MCQNVSLSPNITIRFSSVIKLFQLEEMGEGKGKGKILQFKISNMTKFSYHLALICFLLSEFDPVLVPTSFFQLNLKGMAKGKGRKEKFSNVLKFSSHLSLIWCLLGFSPFPLSFFNQLFHCIFHLRSIIVTTVTSFLT